MTAISTRSEGLRERKKRETLRRITETGLKLFIKNGYEGTMLDEIAAEAGIARRTFFYYFKSKEAILLAYMDGGYARALGPALLAQSTDQTPLAALCASLIKVVASHDSKDAIVAYRLFESTDALRARMQGSYVEMERTAFEVLCEMWPQPDRLTSLRIVAMAAIGAMRIAKEAWRQDEGQQPLAKYLQESFAAIVTIVS